MGVPLGPRDQRELVDSSGSRKTATIRRSAGQKDLSGNCIRDQGATGGGSTPLILGDTRKASWHGQVFGKGPSRKWSTAYQDHCTYVQESNQTGILSPELMSSRHTSFHSMSGEFSRGNTRVGRRWITSQLLRAVEEEHAGFVVNGEGPSSGHLEEVSQGCDHAAPGGGGHGISEG